ncbi:MAG: hypothetical protein U0M60_03845 [Clostridia bacterium]|nr:hypothetical protein [Clostridia bacterium]
MAGCANKAIIDMIYSGILLSDYKKYTKILDRNSKLIGDQAYSECE